MAVPKSKITLKLIISYVIAFLLSLIAFVLFYQQLIRFTETSNQSIDFNEHVFLISETITDLYEVESLGRNLIKKNDSTALQKYRLKIEKINTSIDELVLKYPDTSQHIKINSIKDLLRRKNENVKQLIKIYKRKNTELYYASAIKELKKIDPTFKDYSYTNRFKNLKKHQRKYLINLLEYSRVDNEDNLSNKTIDSIATSVTAVLLKLSRKEKQLQRKIEAKEDEIIENDRVLTSQIRSMLTSMEFEELQLYSLHNKQSKKVLSQTYKIILFFSLLTLVMVITFLYLINRDINKDTQNTIQLEEAKNYSEKLLKNRESLINMVTHDIRAPLNTIMGFLELIENNGAENTNKHYISQMQSSSEYMLHLVNDLLDFSKVEAGKLSIEFVNFQPNLIIENAIRQAIPNKDLKNLQVSITIYKELESLFVSDPYRIRQIAINLIGNAYKFTREGFIKIEATVEYSDQNKPFLKLLVADSGIGIPIEQQEHIFEAFSQSSESNKRNGYGLGLYITKNLIDLLGGSISLKSELGKGSAFTCRIPLKNSEIQQTSKNNINIPAATETTVVLIDDEKSQLVFLEAILEQQNISCVSFENAEKALKFIEIEKPNLVLTDIQMPIIDGFTLVRKMKTNPVTSIIPVIGLTGNSSFSSEEFQTAGFSNHILKPYKPHFLLEKISTLLDLKIDTNTHLNISNNSTYKGLLYDLTDIIHFMDNDIDAVKKVIVTFYESTQNHILEWENAILEKNCVLLKNLAHKMYPMFMQIKASKVSMRLRKLDLEEIDTKENLFVECEKIQVYIIKTMEDLKSFID